jgi:hypothetical protein
LIRKSGGRKCVSEAKINQKYIAAKARESDKEHTGFLQAYPPSNCRAERVPAIIHAGKDMPGCKRHHPGKHGID